MSIDGCPHTFKQLADDVLPADMERMRAALSTPVKMELLVTGRGKVLQQLARRTDFPGCYVLVDCGEPFYVGISRKVVTRLRQHVGGKTHYNASLAYLMACRCCSHSMRRNEAMLHATFRTAFDQEQERIRRMDVAVIEIENPVELYLFEVYCALELRTAVHNSFRTH